MKKPRSKEQISKKQTIKQMEYLMENHWFSERTNTRLLDAIAIGIKYLVMKTQ